MYLMRTFLVLVAITTLISAGRVTLLDLMNSRRITPPCHMVLPIWGNDVCYLMELESTCDCSNPTDPKMVYACPYVKPGTCEDNGYSY